MLCGAVYPPGWRSARSRQQTGARKAVRSDHLRAGSDLSSLCLRRLWSQCPSRVTAVTPESSIIIQDGLNNHNVAKATVRRRGYRKWALGRGPTPGPGTEFRHSIYTIQWHSSISPSLDTLLWEKSCIRPWYVTAAPSAEILLFSLIPKLRA